MPSECGTIIFATFVCKHVKQKAVDYNLSQSDYERLCHLLITMLNKFLTKDSTNGCTCEEDCTNAPELNEESFSNGESVL